MKKIGLLSDTHGYLDPTLFDYLDTCDEIWHAGDFGTLAVADELASFKPLRGVYGNIDDAELRRSFPLNLNFECEGVKVLITHIGGYPGRYTTRVKELIHAHSPDLYICGHSHILKVMYDEELGILHMNPGACGFEGFHRVRTLLRFDLTEGRITGAEVVELGPRSRRM